MTILWSYTPTIRLTWEPPTEATAPHTILTVTESGGGGFLHVVCAAAISPPLADGTTVMLAGNAYAGMSGPLAGDSAGAEFEVSIDFTGNSTGGTWAVV